MNKRFLIPAIALLAAVLIVPVMAAPAAYKVTGGGWIMDYYGLKANFGLNADSTAKGQVEYNIKGVSIFTGIYYHIEMHSTMIMACYPGPAPNSMIIWGQGMVNWITPTPHASFPCTFRIYLTDNGEPGKGNDMFKMTIWNAIWPLPIWPPPVGAWYDSTTLLGPPWFAQTALGGGNIQVK